MEDGAIVDENGWFVGRVLWSKKAMNFSDVKGYGRKKLSYTSRWRDWWKYKNTVKDKKLNVSIKR